MTEFIRVTWRHDLPDSPVTMFYEVLADRSVPRMVEVFPNGKAVARTLAWEQQTFPAFAGISLVDGDMPPIAQIEEPGVFEALAIDADQFANAFLSATPIIMIQKDTP